MTTNMVKTKNLGKSRKINTYFNFNKMMKIETLVLGSLGLFLIIADSPSFI